MITSIAVKSIRNVLVSYFRGEGLKIFITNGASYCIKATKNLKQHFPIMLHITCLTHWLN
uniref:Putative LOC100902024 [Metaseiulus occidentalis] n=1 Tax=Lepeophtheirus salmonis TaxID=72036 RepID=A0A0K2UPB0_LEPSM